MAVKQTIPTEQIGSIPRSGELVEAYRKFEAGEVSAEALDEIGKQETITVMKALEETGSPVISDGEQRKFSGFASYCLHGADNIAPNGVEVFFSDGHSRILPSLSSPPLHYAHSADEFLQFSLKQTKLPVKQSVVSPSMLSLFYPSEGFKDYSNGQMIEDIISQHVGEVRRCLDIGAYKVQLDFTEGRLSVKLDPSGGLLSSFVALINKGMSQFDEQERLKLGVHTCPGSDLDSTHSADVDYKYLLPTLFKINVGNFYIAMASEKESRPTLRLIKQLIEPHQRVFIGVIDPMLDAVETPEQVRDRVLEAADFIPLDQLGTTDDCGFSPFCDDLTTSRELALNKIRSRIQGTKLAEEILLS
ncbi:MAG: 5-methyltetrahydropteroyltriglutamate--homocysteine methyltransferase [Candidatus Thiodiazotropha sp. (ex Lucinoma kastoroae)]|nr:5-methyltetrahydropteroyltriglutamate--homocysteine methyltransferase [Candidatus Thiodiazotropha sp. (ex Lucinoma kastoroae)]MCU7861475.1 5-methyltetrahydropteroyltriglutamate--homocysteine methyltransferase [Candidatus Thiodiazotropha sp. (ex Lucinoma kastoroae)]